MDNIYCCLDTAVYIPMTHWYGERGWLMQMGALNFARETVVHICSDVPALTLVLLLRSRKEKTLLPHNLDYSVLGATFYGLGEWDSKEVLL